MDVAVLPPDISRSLSDVAVVDDDILFGFSNVKGIGKGSAEYLCKIRDHHRVVEQGPAALRDVIEYEQEKWENDRDVAKEEGRSFTTKSPRQFFRTNQVDALVNAGAWDTFISRELPMSKMQKFEKELLGVILTDDCEEIFRANAERLEGCDTYTDLEVNDGGYVHIPGIVATLVPKRTKKDNKAMGIVTIEYQGDEVEFVVFPKQWADYRFLFKERVPGVFTLAKNDKGVRFEKGLKLSE